MKFKQEEGKIDGADFARSIIKYVESSKKRKYINRVKQFREEFEKFKIERDAYVGFHYYIRTYMEDLVKELNQHGAINTQEVYTMINKYSNDKIKVSKEQIDILVKVLDVDGTLFLIHSDSGFIEKK